jgi:sugar/nucleoside kinase (ribokinase family)
MGAGNHSDVWAALRNPAVVNSMCEDYRAGLGIWRGGRLRVPLPDDKVVDTTGGGEAFTAALLRDLP